MLYTSLLSSALLPISAVGRALVLVVLLLCPGCVRRGNFTFRVLETYPHDQSAFTQGLVFVDDQLYEGTGWYGRSSLRRVDLETGVVQQRLDLAPELFGEGVTVFGDRVYQITWREHQGFVYDLETFDLLQQWNYSGEGWGLTHNRRELIMSDGTDAIRFLDPETLEEKRRITVRDGTQPVTWLNELEYVENEIYANIWQSSRIARINPYTGDVLGWIDLTGLEQHLDDTTGIDVLNGIAYDTSSQRLYVTGKFWPNLFLIELVPAE